MSTPTPPGIPDPTPEDGYTEDHDGRTWEWFNGRWVVQPVGPPIDDGPSPEPDAPTDVKPDPSPKVLTAKGPAKTPKDRPHRGGGGLTHNAVADMNRD